MLILKYIFGLKVLFIYIFLLSTLYDGFYSCSKEDFFSIFHFYLNTMNAKLFMNITLFLFNTQLSSNDEF